MHTYLISHMPKQPGAGRLAHKGTGMVAQATVPGVTFDEALENFYRRHPDRLHSVVTQLSAAA